MIRLLSPTVAGHVTQPWRLLGPMISILRSRSSRYALNEIAANHVPVFVLHGDRDLAVPLRTARQAAQRTNGTLITIRDGRHSWLLRDPETLPAIVAQLLPGDLGDACRGALVAEGLDPHESAPDRIEAALYPPAAKVFTLSPHRQVTTIAGRHHRPRFRWTTETNGD
mgnify:FL=1